MRSACLLVMAALIVGAVGTAGCSGDEPEETVLRVLPAGSLLLPFEEIEREFEARHPGVDVQIEGHGSIQVIRQVTDLRREIDVVAVADESLIPDLMYIPMDGSGKNYTDWYVPFAANEMVIAYTDRSRYADAITPTNWAEILSRPDVRVGFSNPMLDAAGYRTLMVVQLAEGYYGGPALFEQVIGSHFNPPLSVSEEGGVSTIALPEILKPSDGKVAIRDGSIYLLSLLDAGGIDYAFEYRSVAEAHGLRWLDLPAEIDLGSPERDPLYRTVKVQLGFQRFRSIGSERTGRHIVYAITIPENAPQRELAEAFVQRVVEEFAEAKPGWPAPLAAAQEE
ncbi:MAG: tungstate ABC transporter substrate-binding protein WtpA [Methanomicrobiales archaeon]|nr:tungstate ABC transporter substrate-binding protein WtpA [Methanomicrobiales archaeon]MDI6876045.1 tungstate ABC transporter substrate-binding protein WtpA [Methanomicrobiales archaeon]